MRPEGQDRPERVWAAALSSASASVRELLEREVHPRTWSGALKGTSSLLGMLGPGDGCQNGHNGIPPLPGVFIKGRGKLLRHG